MIIDQFLIGTMRNFIYLLTDNGESFVIDPQRDLKPWETRLQELGSTLKGVLLTHTHYDHIAGMGETALKYGVPVYVHEHDAFRLKTEAELKFLKDGEKIKIGKKEIEVLHTPGHSAGECCYLIRDTKPWSLLTGDTVFVGMVGRTDLETGSDEEMFETIQRIKKLPHDTVIYPGHDYGKTPTTTIARQLLEDACFQSRNIDELREVP